MKHFFRYRKYNLFNEKGTSITDEPELAFFDTDFGVRFGTFICFDLMFDKPALQLLEQLDIKDYAFSTAWFSELPFLTGTAWGENSRKLNRELEAELAYRTAVCRIILRKV